jgi:cystathionine beta-lyase/cystathionine gamma-synthase
MSHSEPRPDALGSSTPLVTPLYQSSVYTLPDLDALDRILNGEEPGFIYARDGHPNARRLAAELARIERGTWGIVTGSGMAALSAIFLATCKPGDTIVAGNRLYGRTVQLLQQELNRYGVVSQLVDASDLDAVRAALQSPTRLVFVETMSNPLCRLVDVAALAELAHAAGALLVVDNTFATPELLRPLELGADLVMESLTKMIGGHSDVTLGLVAGTVELQQEIAQVVSIWGLAANPFDCWLAERGLATLSVRMRSATANAVWLADWLAKQPGVSRVLYPGRADHPDHALAGRLFPEGAGNMLCFDLAGGRAAVNDFMHKATHIPFSPSLGHMTTTCSHPDTTSHRYTSPAEKTRQGITAGLIRLSVGCEPAEALRAAMGEGLV